jgi:hypothetical protein
MIGLARHEFEKMVNSFKVNGNVAWVTVDGGVQGAYVAGYDLAVQINHGIFFVSTYKESLGIPEGFVWLDPPTKENPMSSSGPVWGSKQFVKCRNVDELGRVLEIARKHLGV